MNAQIKIVAHSNVGVFVGLDAERNYVVISLDDTKVISLGDVLRSTSWDDRDGLFKAVLNETKGESVRICIENWDCSAAVATDLLNRLNSPTKIVSA